MKPWTKALLGVGTCWVSAVTFLLPLASLVWHRWDTGPPSPTGRALFVVLSTLHLLLAFGLWLFYLRYVATSDRIEARARGRWVLLLVVCPPVMMPSAFFRLVLREP